MARVCIFCGGKPLTLEHVFPMWLSPIFKPPIGKKLYISAQSTVDGVLRRQPTRFPGRLDIKIKYVCQSCNGGWMERLERKVKPVITALQQGTMTTITSDDQATLAAWAAKTAITIQYIGPRPLVPLVPLERRRWMHIKHTPPEGTAVCVTRYDGEGLATTGTKNLFFRKPDGSLFNLPHGQIVLFNVGSVLFLVVACYIPGVRIECELPRDIVERLLQIWTIKTPTVSWPSSGLSEDLRRHLSDFDWGKADIIVRRVVRFVPSSPSH